MVKLVANMSPYLVGKPGCDRYDYANTEHNGRDVVQEGIPHAQIS